MFQKFSKVYATVQAGWIFKIPNSTRRWGGGGGDRFFSPPRIRFLLGWTSQSAPIFCPPRIRLLLGSTSRQRLFFAHRNSTAKPLNYLSENAVGETLSLMAIQILLVTSEWLTGAFVWRSQTSIIKKKKKKKKKKERKKTLCVFLFSICWLWYSSNYLYHGLKDASVW